MGGICVNCGWELYEDRCKVRCPRCGYFEDCSDPSAPGEWAPGGDANTLAPTGGGSDPEGGAA
jgi:hypothetical protein